MATYRVTSARKYREHEPGSTFVAELDPAEEARAVERGSIEVVNRRRVKLDRRKATPPKKKPE